MAAFFAAYSGLWWSDLGWEVLLGGMAVIFGAEVAVLFHLKTQGRIAAPLPHGRRDISAMTLPERARYAWSVFIDPGRPGYNVRLAFGFYLGSIAAEKVTHAGTGYLIVSIAVSTVVAASAPTPNRNQPPSP